MRAATKLLSLGLLLYNGVLGQADPAASVSHETSTHLSHSTTKPSTSGTAGYHHPAASTPHGNSLASQETNLARTETTTGPSDVSASENTRVSATTKPQPGGSSVPVTVSGISPTDRPASTAPNDSTAPTGMDSSPTTKTAYVMDPELQKAAEARRIERLVGGSKSDPVPSFLVFTNITGQTNSFRWIYDSSSPTRDSTFTKFMVKDVLKDFPLDGVDVETHLETGLNKTNVTLWLEADTMYKNRVADLLQWPMSQADLRARPVLDNVALVTPLALWKVRETWPFLASLQTARAVPAEIIIITGLLSDKNAGSASEWLFLRHVLETQVVANLPPGVVVKWGAFEGVGGAMIARKLGALNTKMKYLICFDSDDFVLPNGLQLGVQYLEQNLDADMILVGYGAYPDQRNATSASEVVENVVTRLKFEEVNHAPQWWRVNFAERKEHWLETFKTWFKPNPKTQILTDYEPGSLIGLPSVFYSANCQKLMSEMIAAEMSMIGKYDAVKEYKSFEYFHELCMNKAGAQGTEMAKSLAPSYVYECANGWSVSHRAVFVTLPVTSLGFGEDSLFNYFAAMQGYNIICEGSLAIGLYKTQNENDHLIGMKD